MHKRPEIPDAVVDRVLVELGVLPAPPGYQPVPWKWGRDGSGHRVVHTRDCPRAASARPWFWAAGHCPDNASLLALLPSWARSCPHCLGDTGPVRVESTVPLGTAERAEREARRIVEQVTWNMALEGQRPDDAAIEKIVQTVALELLKGRATSGS